MGRPKKPFANVNLGVRVSPETAEAIYAGAADEGISMSGFCRRILEAYCKDHNLYLPQQEASNVWAGPEEN